ncbi:MAG: ATP-binding protein, partial [bacterium]
MTDGSASVATQGREERELRIPAEEGQLSRVRDFIAEVCEEAGFSSREANNTKLAVDEACTNIIKHAYDKKPGDIRIRTVIGPGHVSVKLHDTGERFDFAGVEDPDLDHYVETGRKGGLGVFLINRLMDKVQYRAGDTGNELTMTKTSHAGLARSLPGRISWRGTLRYKFTLRASLGLFVLLAAIWSFVFIRQTGTIKEQQTTQWIEKRRLAENLAERSKAALLQTDPFSVERTDLTAYLTKVVEGNNELDYVRVVDPEKTILASNNVDEIYQPYQSPPGEVLLQKSDNVAWSHFEDKGRPVRDIAYTVRMKNEDAGRELNLGVVHLGVLEMRPRDVVGFL